MLRKTRSEVPDEAFIPKPARVMAILQLCVVFTIVCWLGSWPFMGKMLEHKRETFLFQTVLGGGDLIARTYEDQPGVLQKIERNRKRFLEMPSNEKELILNSYNELISLESQSGFWSKCRDGLQNILIFSSPWLRAWVVFALMAAILLLKKSPGAPMAVWILPVLALMLWFEAAQSPRLISSDEAFFPTENYLISTYGNGALDNSISMQHAQLSLAWERYLASEWSTTGDAEEGDWRFQLTRLKNRLAQKIDRDTPPSGLVLCLFFIWNCGFAWVAYRWKTPLKENFSAA